MGLNAGDGIVVAVSVALLAGILVPSFPGAVPPLPAPRLEAAALVDHTLRVTFSPPAFATSDDWAAFVRVQLSGRDEAVWNARVAEDGAFEFLLPSGAAASDDVTITLAANARLADANGRVVEPFDRLPVRVEVAPWRLPSGRSAVQGAWLDGAFYVFGGWVWPGDPWSTFGASADVVRIDPASGLASVLPARFPHPIQWTVVATDPRSTPDCPKGCAYLYGGIYAQPPAAPGLDPTYQRAERVFRFEPASGRLDEFAVIPRDAPWEGVCAGWLGDAIYVFGGISERSDPLRGGVHSEDVWRLDPIAGTFERLPTRLPWGLTMAGTVFDPRVTPECPRGCGYLLGGWHTTWKDDASFGTNPRVSDVLRFDPASGAVTPLPLRVPGDSAIPWTQAAFLDGAAYWMGYVGPADDHETVLLRFDPAAGRLDNLGAPDGAPIGGAAVVTDGIAVWGAGGADAVHSRRDVTRLVPPPPGGGAP